MKTSFAVSALLALPLLAACSVDAEPTGTAQPASEPAIHPETPIEVSDDIGYLRIH